MGYNLKDEVEAMLVVNPIEHRAVSELELHDC